MKCAQEINFLLSDPVLKKCINFQLSYILLNNRLNLNEDFRLGHIRFCETKHETKYLVFLHPIADSQQK